MDTPETTETNQTPDADTEETVEKTGEWTGEKQSEYVKNIFNPKNLAEITAEEESQADEQSDAEEDADTESEEEEGYEDGDDEAEEEQEEEEEEGSEEPDEIVIEVDGKKETFDLKDEEQRKRLIQFAGKGRYLEKEREKDAKEKQEVLDFANELSLQSATLGYQILHLASKGEISPDDFTEKPYEDFIGEGEDEKEDRRLWNEHNRKVKVNQQRLIEYEKRFKSTQESMGNMVASLKEAHPEISDPVKWVQENVVPYHAPVMSYGAEKYPEDTLEMIYFWKNKDKIIKEKVDEAVKNYVKKPRKIKSPVSSKSSEGIVQADPARELVSRIFGSKDRKLVRN